jgi:hypothetical protein
MACPHTGEVRGLTICKIFAKCNLFLSQLRELRSCRNWKLLPARGGAIFSHRASAQPYGRTWTRRGFAPGCWRRGGLCSGAPGMSPTAAQSPQTPPDPAGRRRTSPAPARPEPRPGHGVAKCGQKLWGCRGTPSLWRGVSSGNRQFIPRLAPAPQAGCASFSVIAGDRLVTRIIMAYLSSTSSRGAERTRDPGDRNAPCGSRT